MMLSPSNNYMATNYMATVLPLRISENASMTVRWLFGDITAVSGVLQPHNNSDEMITYVIHRMSTCHKPCL
jgi:hypothetical protein